MVSVWAYSELLFRESKRQESTGRVSLGTAILHALLSRRYDLLAKRGQRAGRDGKGTQAGHGQDPFISEPSTGGSHGTLSLPFERHHRASTLLGSRRCSHYVSGFGRRRTNAVGVKCGGRSGAERAGPRGWPDFGLCTLCGAWTETRGCFKQRQPAPAGFGS